MKAEITTRVDKADAKNPGIPEHTEMITKGQADPAYRQPIRETLQRYCSIVMITAVVAGGIMILLDLRPMGKGFILGAIFSVINFTLMATALPMNIGSGRKKAFLFSLGSIHLRFALMAVPLVISFKYDQFVASTSGRLIWLSEP